MILSNLAVPECLLHYFRASDPISACVYISCRVSYLLISFDTFIHVTIDNLGFILPFICMQSLWNVENNKTQRTPLPLSL